MDRISIGLVVGKAAVSKFAVERNRVKTRFKAAMREAVQREQAEGRRLLLSELTYLVTLRKECFSTPMEGLIQEVRTAFGSVVRKAAVEGWKSFQRVQKRK